MRLFLQEAHEGGHVHEPPHTIFTGLWHHFKDSAMGRWYGFDTARDNLGQFWFEAICFSLLSAAVLIVCAFLATRNYSRVPRGIQNIFEWAVQLLRGLVHSFTGPEGDKYVPYLGTVFLFIFTMNMIGIIPGFRSPTMTLSTTAALGITTFIMVQTYAIKAVGVGSYVKHFMGDILWLAPLMLLVEIIGELARPLSLSLRLFGNIFGEDNVIEQLLTLGGWIPIQVPMLAIAIFTSFLQAFIFTTLSTIYIASKVAHGEHNDESHAPEAHHS